MNSDRKTSQTAIPQYGTVPPNIEAGSQYQYLNPQVVHVIHDYNPRSQRRRSTFARFCKAVLCAGAAWLLLSVLVHNVVFWARHGYAPWPWRYDGDYPVPDDMKLGRCMSPDDWSIAQAGHVSSDLPHNDGRPRFPFKSSHSFDLPLAPDALWFISKGRLSAGNVDFVTSPDQKPGEVKYEVVVHYFRQAVRDLAEVCLISKYDGKEEGVGIFTPSWYPHWGREDSLFFETTVTLPENEEGLLYLNRLESDTTNTIHRTSHLARKVQFKEVNFKSTNSPMLIFSLAASQGSVITTNGPIRGIFNTTSVLKLVTSNAHIKAAVGMTNNGTEPKTVVRTTNGPIDAEFSLFSAKKDSPGTFHIDAVTSNSPLDVIFPTAPVDSTLHFEAKTSNSKANVILHPTFEGSFSARTSSVFPVTVQNDEKAEDPSGKGRDRRLIFEGRTGRGVKAGYASWGDKEKNDLEGEVGITTSNSAVFLQV